jgi:hypothetical protein
MADDFQTRLKFWLLRGMVALISLAPEKAELLNNPNATMTVGGSSRWVKDT